MLHVYCNGLPYCKGKHNIDLMIRHDVWQGETLYSQNPALTLYCETKNFTVIS